MTRSSLLRSALGLLAIPATVSCQALRGKKSRKVQAALIPVGEEIAAWAHSVLGTRVERGECWDLAQVALDHHRCLWSRVYEYGRKLSPREAARPGDIIQFHKARFEWTEPDRSRHWLDLGEPEHTAIILVSSGRQIRVAHQNFNHVRKVTALDINLAHHRSGRYEIFRPVRAAA